MMVNKDDLLRAISDGSLTMDDIQRIYRRARAEMLSGNPTTTVFYSEKWPPSIQPVYESLNLRAQARTTSSRIALYFDFKPLIIDISTFERVPFVNIPVIGRDFGEAEFIRVIKRMQAQRNVAHSELYAKLGTNFVFPVPTADECSKALSDGCITWQKLAQPICADYHSTKRKALR